MSETKSVNTCKNCGEEITWGKDPKFEKWVMLEWKTPVYELVKKEGEETQAIWAKGYKAKHLCPLAPTKNKDDEIPF